MKRKYFPKAWLSIAGAVFACACSGSKPQQTSSKPSEEMKKEENKGPQQEPFKKCDAMDSECEEGASSDLFRGQKQTEILIDLPTVANLDNKEQALFVTPIVVEAVKMQVPVQEPVASVQEKAAEKEEKPSSETVAAPSPDQAS